MKINHDKLGQQALDKFVSTRMVEKSINFWNAQKKKYWSYFKDVGATHYTLQAKNIGPPHALAYT